MGETLYCTLNGVLTVDYTLWGIISAFHRKGRSAKIDISGVNVPQSMSMENTGRTLLGVI